MPRRFRGSVETEVRPPMQPWRWPTWLTSATPIDSNSNIYFADSINQRIRRIDTSGTITTVAGSGTAPATNSLCQGTSPVGDGGSAAGAHLFNPSAAMVDPKGNLIVADQQNNRIRQVNSAGNITTIVGSGQHNFYSP